MPIHAKGISVHTDVEEGLRAGGAKLSARRQAVRRVVAAGLSDKRAQTQALLLEAGRDLFTEKGIGATSVGDICSRAGFTRGAFYSNFTDMDHFVRRLAEQQWSAMRDFVRGAVNEAFADQPESTDSPLNDAEVQGALEELASHLLRAMPVSREYILLQTEFITYILRNDERSAPLLEVYQDFKASLRDLLVSGLARIGRETILSPDDTTDLLFAAAERSMRQALFEKEGRLTDQLDRTLPVLISHLSQSKA